MVIGTILAILVIVALFIGFGMFFNRMQGRSQQRYDANNSAGTLRDQPYRRPHQRSGHRGRRARSDFDDGSGPGDF